MLFSFPNPLYWSNTATETALLSASPLNFIPPSEIIYSAPFKYVYSSGVHLTNEPDPVASAQVLCWERNSLTAVRSCSLSIFTLPASFRIQYDAAVSYSDLF